MHEEAYIERQPVAERPAESEIGQGEVKVPSMAEQASAEKRSGVKEEVRLWKRQVHGSRPLQRICHRIWVGARRYILEISSTRNQVLAK